ncbi:MAG: outer membrane beta-barrel domain-containing protein [Deltaproteobacteria bacterium]|nr:outer membrane beta-barrel domain-containing protein [Deltaproteobacteria bacterium]
MRTSSLLRSLPLAAALLAAATCAGAAYAEEPAAGADAPKAEAPAAEPAKAEPAKAEEPKAEPAPEAKPEPKPEAKPSKAKKADDMPDLGGAGAIDQDMYGIGDDSVPPGSRMEWAVRRDIRVVQKRAVIKEGRHGFSLITGVVPNDDFWTYVVGGLGYNYYVSEDLALAVHGAYTADIASSLPDKLQGKRDDGGYELKVRLPQTLLGYASAGADWNLMHGKIRFFSTRLFEFDLALCVGIGAIATKVTVQNAVEAKTRVDPGGNVGGYAQFYLTERLAFRIDFHQLFYPAYDDKKDTPTGGLSHPLATTIALTYFTAPPQ